MKDSEKSYYESKKKTANDKKIRKKNKKENVNNNWKMSVKENNWKMNRRENNKKKITTIVAIIFNNHLHLMMVVEEIMMKNINGLLSLEILS